MVSSTLDRPQHGLGVVVHGFQPTPDVRARFAILDAETDEDRNAFAPEFVTAIRVNRRVSARSDSYGFFLFCLCLCLCLWGRYCNVSYAVSETFHALC